MQEGERSENHCFDGTCVICNPTYSDLYYAEAYEMDRDTCSDGIRMGFQDIGNYLFFDDNRMLSISAGRQLNAFADVDFINSGIYAPVDRGSGCCSCGIT